MRPYVELLERLQSELESAANLLANTKRPEARRVVEKAQDLVKDIVAEIDVFRRLEVKVLGEPE